MLSMMSKRALSVLLFFSASESSVSSSDDAICAFINIEPLCTCVDWWDRSTSRWRTCQVKALELALQSHPRDDYLPEAFNVLFKDINPFILTDGCVLFYKIQENLLVSES
jgi:hypothetical protein